VVILEDHLAVELLTSGKAGIEGPNRCLGAYVLDVETGEIERFQARLTLLATGGVGKVYLHAVVDTYSSYAFGFLHTSKQPEAAVSVVHNDVMPFYKKHKLKLGAILTDNGTEFCGTPEHPFELYLALCEIEHRRTKVGRPQTNGFVERFNRTVKEEFFETVTRTTLYTSVAQLQADLDKWLVHYNRERTHQGYRNQGRRPYETIKQYLDTVKKAA